MMNDSEKKNLINDFNNGMTYKNIQKKYRINSNKIIQICGRRGKSGISGRKEKTFDEKQITEIKYLLSIGVSKSRICEKFDISYGTLNKIITTDKLQ